MSRRVARLAFLFVVALPAASQDKAPVASGLWQEVENALGRAGDERDGVFRVAFPRSDLHVRVAGVNLRPGLALTSWAAFQKAGNVAMVMGDLVLLVAEVPPVLAKLSAAGVEITALHNHLVGEAPRVMYVHYHGHGNAAELATALRAALATSATPLATPRSRADSNISPAAGTLDVEMLSNILGRKGTARAGVVSFSVPRAEPITAGGAALGPRMGVATAINLQADGSGAATTGDFVLLASEVQPVITALRQHEIEVTALHNHMLDEQPRLFFLHFWGRGAAEKLARGLRAALDMTAHAANR